MHAAPDSVRAALSSKRLFNGIPEATLKLLASLSRMHAVAELATFQFSPAEFIFLARGRLEITYPATRENWTLHAGDTFCEYDWLAEQASYATAHDGVEFLAINRGDLDEVLLTHPVLRIRIAQEVRQRIECQGLRAALRRSELFGPMEDGLRQEMETALEPLRLFGGENLFGQGDRGDSLYVVVNGRLRVLTKEHASGQAPLAEIGPGETVGEMALMTGKGRSGSVWAVRDTHLGHLTREAYRGLLRRHPEEMMRLFGGRVAERLERANRGESRKSSDIRTVAVVPAGAGVRIAEFCSELVRSLAGVGHSACVSSETICRQFGDPQVAQTADWDGSSFGLSEWMSRLEHDHACVVYQADPGLTPWTERCIRQGDEVIIVGEASGDPAPGEIETELLDHLPGRTAQKRSLVLIHPPRGIISGASNWLSIRGVSRHYHVRLGQEKDFDRLARFLTGRAVGIALGGGFARGLAHIGVFEALDSLGIPVDAVGGASMGAIVGGLWAQGWSYQRCIQEIREGCRESLNDMTLPFVAFKRGGKFSDLILKFFGDSRIEDLPRPYFCVSANLNRAEVAMHTHGNLAKAVLASTRAPAIFPPIVYDGELHVDGGLINNVPVDLMKPFTNHGVVFGVDVSPPHELSGVADYGYDVSGWDAARSRFGIFGRKKNYLPSILLVLMRTIEFGGVAYKTARDRFADVYLQPPLLGFKRTDWHLAEQIVEVSRQYALEQLERWLETPGAARVRPRADKPASRAASTGGGELSG